MKTYESLYELCETLSEKWKGSASEVNDQDAVSLVMACQAVLPMHLNALPSVKAAANVSVDGTIDYDYFLALPALITDELENSDCEYTYEQNGDEWEVISVRLSGERDSIGSLETEALAKEVVETLMGTDTPTTLPVLDICMPDIVGDYDVPEEVPEWEWVEEISSYGHKRNNQSGIWEFMVNLQAVDMDESCGAIPEKLKGVFEKAHSLNCGYILFHQGT